MKATRVLACMFMVLGVVTLTSAQSLVTVYSHDFDTPVGPEWSKIQRSTTPNLVRTFLGRFGGEPVDLDLINLPQHCSMTITFDLLIIDSWEGSVGFQASPDVWDLEAFSRDNCCPVKSLLHTTFANCACKYQAYPDDYPDVHHPGWTGAEEINTLGYEWDSVYHLSFTFFHDMDDVTFRFAATPLLQALADESWGIDNLVVEVDADGAYCCRATRELPIYYGADTDVPVSIDVQLNPHAQAYVIEEEPPADWIVTGINDAGVYEASSGKIKWGPYFGTQGRTLSYFARPPIGATGSSSFDGVMVVDGVTEPVCGDDEIDSGSYHPVDLDADWLVEAAEFTSYAAAWRKGDPWSTEPNPIPADYVTNAGMLWRTGEAYEYSPTDAPPWASTAKLAHAAPAKATASAVAGFSAPTYSPGEPLEVVITVTPGPGTSAFVIEDTPPSSWAVSSVSNGGSLDPVNGKIKWGVFFDGQPHTVSYTITPPAQARGTLLFGGLASFDGTSIPIDGKRLLPQYPDQRRVGTRSRAGR